MSLEDAFSDVVRRELAFLFDEHGFRMTEANSHVVLLMSPALGVQAVWDPRGEVYVAVFRREAGVPAEGWSWTGMVGKASVPRLLEMAGERMRAESWVLAADAAKYEELAIRKRRESREWTDYYSRKGPRPRSGHLP